MRDFIKILSKSSLFSGIDEEHVVAMLGCLQATTRHYTKGAFILRPGDSVNGVGLVLAGRLLVVREDYWGNREIVSSVSPGNLFAEVFACIPEASATVGVVADEECTIMLLDVRRILTTCSSSCAFHALLIENLVRVLAQKNLMMNEKLGHLSRRSTREKILSFLSAEALRQGTESFSIPFNRQQFADYLSVDRSAMSAELSRMRREGLIEFRRSQFELKNVGFL